MKNKVGELLKEARVKQGWPRGELIYRLRKSGISLTESSLFRYELGKSSPSARILGGLCKVLGLRLMFPINGEIKESENERLV